MPMLTDPRLLDEALNRKNTRAFLLVFVTQETNTREIWKVINDFNYEPETKRHRVDIFFPISPAPGDPPIERIWQRYNPQRIAPLCVFLGEGGRETGIRIEGMPVTAQLSSSLRDLDRLESA